MLSSNQIKTNGQLTQFYNIWVSILQHRIHVLYDERKSQDKSSEHIVMCQDDLYVASTTLEEISIFYKTNTRSIFI